MIAPGQLVSVKPSKDRVPTYSVPDAWNASHVSHFTYGLCIAVQGWRSEGGSVYAKFALVLDISDARFGWVFEDELVTGWLDRDGRLVCA